MNTLHIAVAVTAINCGLFLSALTQAPAAGPRGDSVLRGRALELVDERGRIRARLNVETDGQVVFRLLDRRGTIRVKLGAGEDGSGLLLANDATEPGVHLVAGATGSSVRVVGKDGRERLIAP